MVSSSQPASYTYGYDRWGNRWSQNVKVGESGPQPQLSFNTSTNQVTGTGYSYDAAGNLTSDGTYTFAYDPEHNMTQVDSGAYATYTYDERNDRVRIDGPGDAYEYLFDINAKRASYFDVDHGWQLSSQTYWGTTPVEFAEASVAHFQHQDWLGTERMRTTYNGGVEGSFSSLPYGDGYTVTGSDNDGYHFAGMDGSHAQFREYDSTQGRWAAPDPYSGSYDFSNPQSFNRYAYVNNNPMSYVDPNGLNLCAGNCGCDGEQYNCAGGGGNGDGGDLSYSLDFGSYDDPLFIVPASTALGILRAGFGSVYVGEDENEQPIYASVGAGIFFTAANGADQSSAAGKDSAIYNCNKPLNPGGKPAMVCGYMCSGPTVSSPSVVTAIIPRYAIQQACPPPVRVVPVVWRLLLRDCYRFPSSPIKWVV